MADLTISLLSVLWAFPLSSHLLLFFLLCICAFLGKGIQNRYFHPLSKFPGPFWASVTDLYLVFFIPSVPIFGLKLHKKHG